MVARLADHTLVRLRRTGCYGWCPEYVVEVGSGGEVTYVGGNNVMTIGPATDELSLDSLRKLDQTVNRAKQAQMPRAECACDCTADAPSVELTTWERQVPRTVVYDRGCEQVPPPIRALELEVDRVVGIQRWIGTEDERRACFEEKRDCKSLVGVPEPSSETEVPGL
jgi:hypothetical protein